VTAEGKDTVKVSRSHIEQRREAIRNAAQRLFVRKGVEGARMEEIAAEAGLSAGAIYRYYPSKEALLQAVLAQHIEHNQELFHDRSALDSPLALLLAKGRMVWEQHRTEEGRQQCIVGLESALAAVRYAGGVAEERRRMWGDAIEFSETLLRMAQARGEIDAALDPRALATTLLAAWVGLGIFSLDFGEELDLDASFDTLVRLLRGGAPEHSPLEESGNG
jgi:AcrR family transcriptional regulator